MYSIAAVLAITASAAYALCPNSCSGHGTCGANDACACDYNFAGADCSERVCAYGLAFADQPLGDLNHDGTVATGGASTTNGAITNGVFTQNSNLAVHERFQGTQNNEAHFYSECSGKGDCNRETGECACFAGYTGSSCQRSTCPNDCSGHGRCRTIGEIAKGQMNKVEKGNAAGVVTYGGVEATNYVNSAVNENVYALWDADKNQACVCDAGYSGADCTLRLCPRGDDPLTGGDRYNGKDSNGDEPDQFTITFSSTLTNVKFEVIYTDWSGRKQYGYTDYFSVTASTDTATPETALTVNGRIQSAIRAATGGGLQSVTTSLATAGGNDVITVLFTGVGGTAKERALAVNIYDQATGAVSAASVAIVSGRAGNTEAVECANRGLCDYSTGMCSCFAGYYGIACENQNALQGSDSPAGVAAAPAAEA